MIADATELLRSLEHFLPYIATLAAIAAFWVSWREVGRNNKVFVKLRKFSSHMVTSPTGNAYELEVSITNRGIQMQDISMRLSFAGPGKSGYCYLPIPLSEQSRGAGSIFLRGTTARFALRGAEGDAEFLAGLRDFREQTPLIDVFNSSFLACSFPVYSRWDWLKRCWNQVNSRLKFKRRVGDGIEGKGVFTMFPLPFFVIRSEQLRFFMNGLKKVAATDTIEDTFSTPH